jgi:Replication-relaxation
MSVYAWVRLIWSKQDETIVLPRIGVASSVADAEGRGDCRRRTAAARGRAARAEYPVPRTRGRVCELYVTLKTALPDGLRLAGFRARGRGAGGVRGYDGKEHAVAPDACIQIAEADGLLLGLVELDLGTKSARQLKAKAEGYGEYTKLEGWRQRNEYCPPLLFITTSEKRARSFFRHLRAGGRPATDARRRHRAGAGHRPLAGRAGVARGRGRKRRSPRGPPWRSAALRRSLSGRGDRAMREAECQALLALGAMFADLYIFGSPRVSRVPSGNPSSTGSRSISGHASSKRSGIWPGVLARDRRCARLAVTSGRGSCWRQPMSWLRREAADDGRATTRALRRRLPLALLRRQGPFGLGVLGGRRRGRGRWLGVQAMSSGAGGPPSGRRG